MGASQTKSDKGKALEDTIQKGEKIGQGAYGKVYEGFYKANPQKKVAIKEFSNYNDYKEEYQNAKNINKYYSKGCPPYLMCMIDTFNDHSRGKHYIIYKKLTKSLQAHMKSEGIKNTDNIATYSDPVDKKYVSKLKDMDIYAVVNTLIVILERLDSLSLSHRDIKMGNILVNDGVPIEVVLGDMGFLCKTYQSPVKGIKSCELVRGTYEFFPPWLSWNSTYYKRKIDPMWQDIYSTGVTIYSFLTGKLARPTKGSPYIDFTRDIKVKNSKTNKIITIPGEIITKLVNTMIFSQTFEDAYKYRNIWRPYKNIATRKPSERVMEKKKEGKRSKKRI